MNITGQCITPDTKKPLSGLKYFTGASIFSDDGVSCGDDGGCGPYVFVPGVPLGLHLKKLPEPQPKQGRLKPLKTQGRVQRGLLRKKI
ncbi:MAG TPA: hypothetical protein VHS53_11370 [Mucilaginibacter sp.]|nr:hypothetical protein [Mucilaginibacter sp.]